MWTRSRTIIVKYHLKTYDGKLFKKHISSKCHQVRRHTDYVDTIVFCIIPTELIPFRNVKSSMKLWIETIETIGR